MPIDVASSGETPEAARLAVDEDVTGLLLAAFDHRTLQDVLEEDGYRRVRGKWRCPFLSGMEQRSVLATVQEQPCPSSRQGTGGPSKRNFFHLDLCEACDMSDSSPTRV